MAERYIRLGLRLDRHVEGTVDAYFGPPELAAEVAAAPPVDPRALVADAAALLADLDDGWLRDQVTGLHTYARVVAGERLDYADEVEGCYGIRPTHTDEAVFAAAHKRLEELLPGDGPLDERRERWRRSITVPPDRIEQALVAVIAEARARTLALIDLPDGEGVVVEGVRDVSWLGYNFYLGDLRGRVAVNLDMPTSAVELLLLGIHETYPGHQAERAAKEQRLVRGRGLLEETIVLAPCPQSLISEGIGQVAPMTLLAGAGAAAFETLARDAAGVDFDLAHALAVERAAEPCRWAEVNAALMLHADGASEDDVREYLRRWGVMGDEMAGHVVRFMTEPTSRTYIVNYPAGRALCGAYVGDDLDRLRQLLTEQVRVGELRSHPS
ncbi:hypothetical protein GCM10009682_56000 [Luedemannella flava]|uniref:DUF885 domain-containing protein n=1 Tax=Luedemannella flava TaxID=349316 RepID=A0ABP4YT18_9ACTN